MPVQFVFPKGLKKIIKSFVDIVKTRCINIDHELILNGQKKFKKYMHSRRYETQKLLLKDEKEL